MLHHKTAARGRADHDKFHDHVVVDGRSQIWKEGEFGSVWLGFHPPQVVTCIDEFKESWDPKETYP
jgi:hypothetical protein